MTNHPTATREERQAANEKLIERERELTQLRNELTRERQELPWVPVEKEYTLETDEGTKTLTRLFDGRSQLLVYHIMFGPHWTAACPACSQLADHFDGMLPHLEARDVTLIGVSHAPLEKLQAYKRRMGWHFPYASSFHGNFNYDFEASFTEEQQPEIARQVLPQFSEDPMIAEMAASCGTDVAGYVTTEGPGLSAFVLDDGAVYHTYFTRDVDFMVFYPQVLERAPNGGKADVPVRRHDEYPEAAVAGKNR